MAKIFCSITAAILLAAACAWAQSGVYTNQFQVSAPAPTAPNPFSPGTSHQSQTSFVKPALQHFNSFRDANRGSVILIRNRIISGPHHGPTHGVTPLTSIRMPSLRMPTAIPLDPYSYTPPENGPHSGQLNGLFDQLLPSGLLPQRSGRTSMSVLLGAPVSSGGSHGHVGRNGGRDLLGRMERHILR